MGKPAPLRDKILWIVAHSPGITAAELNVRLGCSTLAARQRTTRQLQHARDLGLLRTEQPRYTTAKQSLQWFAVTPARVDAEQKASAP